MKGETFQVIKVNLKTLRPNQFWSFAGQVDPSNLRSEINLSVSLYDMWSKLISNLARAAAAPTDSEVKTSTRLVNENR